MFGSPLNKYMQVVEHMLILLSSPSSISGLQKSLIIDSKGRMGWRKEEGGVSEVPGNQEPTSLLSLSGVVEK